MKKKPGITTNFGQKALYLYCFADAAKLTAIDGTGIDEKNPLFLNTADGVTAVMSMVDVHDFIGPGGESNLQDIEWIGPRAYRHQTVIETAMRESPVLPASFGTLYTSERNLTRLMAAHRETIIQFFGRISDKQEWSVKGYVNQKNAVRNIAVELLADAAGDLADLPAGARYFKEKQIQAEAKTRLDGWVNHSRLMLADMLEPIAVDINERKIMSREASGKDLDMVLNWAALIHEDAIRAFRDEVDRVNSDQGFRGLTLEMSGPWPPYSFCPTLEMEGDAN